MAKELQPAVEESRNASGEGGAGQAGTLVDYTSIVPPDTDTVKMCDEAKALAALGFRVHPVYTPADAKGNEDPTIKGKTPRATDWPTLATTDPKQIEAWWTQWPNANIGIRTGENRLVLDVDGSEGKASIKGRALPPTASVRTGSGGFHYYYKMPEGKNYRNKVRLLPGIDIRGEGGQAVAPPSMHGSGQRYEWLIPPDAFALCPDWLCELLEMQERFTGDTTQAPAKSTDTTTPYGNGAIRNISAKLAAAAKGTRNNTLFICAAAMGNLVGGGEIAEADARAALEQAALENGVMDDEPQATAATITSGLTKGKQEPRCAPVSAPVSAEPGGPPLFDKDDPTLHTTDSGLSKRLVVLYGQNLRYIWSQDTWLCWNGKYWEADDGIVHGYAGELPLKMLEAARKIGDGDERTQALKFVIKSEGERSRRAAVNLARSLPGIPVKLDELDANPWLFNCANGTLNLKTGRLREHQRADLMTLSSPVNFDDEAQSEAWDEFLDDCTGGDPELLRYLAQIAGYALTGVTQEEIFPFVYGPGRSGKSTFLAALHSILGPYAHMAAFDTFTVGGSTTKGSHRDDIAALAGKRLVVALETKKGAGFDEGMIKSITGGDIINARAAYGKTMNFKPQFKLILAANDRPRVDDMDDALWWRLREVPFPYTVDEDRVDMTLKTRLTDTTVNGPAILAWAVRGCLDWQAEKKLITPSCVSKATAEYREEQDPLSEFFAEYCVMRPGAEAPAAGLYSAYTEYAKANGVRRPMTAIVFGKRLETAGFSTDRKYVNGKQVRVRIGIGLRDIS